jgi:hypothetical protein
VVLVGPCNLSIERIDVVAGILSNAPDAKVVVLLQDDDETIAVLVWSSVVGRPVSVSTLFDALKRGR